MGGPSAKEIGLSPDLRSRLSPGGASFQLASTRYYVYGPGDDGVFVEYLYRAPGAVDDLLLTRAGRVRNDGGNRFGFEFGLPLRPYEARASPTPTGLNHTRAPGLVKTDNQGRMGAQRMNSAKCACVACGLPHFRWGGEGATGRLPRPPLRHGVAPRKV